MYNFVFWLIIAFLIIDFVFEKIVSYLNAKDFGKPLPVILQDIYDADKYKKQQLYSSVNHKFGNMTSVVSMVVILCAFCFGLFGWLDGVLRTVIDNEILLALSFFGILYLANTIIDLPFSYYQTFVIEQKFEFNKSTKKLFFTDQIKGLLLTAVIGGLLMSAIIYIYSLTPNYFWIFAWLLVSALSIFMIMFYSQLIVPLFNKQTPLEDGELKTKLNEFAHKAGFTLTDIYVIDGSKRSTKANAYFSGLGAKKRVVLYDTLIKDLTADEITAVLAHEIGHYKKKHSLSMLAISLINNLVMFGLLGLCLSSPLLSEALGSDIKSFHLGILAFGVLYSPLSTVLSLSLNVLSRKNEYQADAYACEFGYGDDLISALKKLSAKSLSNLQPHAAYVFVHYSHPTLLQRMIAINNAK